MIIADPYTTCPRCDAYIAFLAPQPDEFPIVAVEEDSLSIYDMSSIEEGNQVLFDPSRHKQHSERCNELEDWQL